MTLASAFDQDEQLPNISSTHREPSPVRFGILGPVELHICGQLSTPSARKPRTLLAILLVRANTTVSVDALIQELWGDNTTPTAVTALRVYVSQLRKLLTRSDGNACNHGCAIVTTPSGYMLQAPPESLDTLAFEQFRRRGNEAWSAGKAEHAAREYHHALGLWRGPALADVSGTSPLVGVAARQLEENRIATLERRIDADLKLGRHRELIAEIRGVVAEYPMHEGPYARLMVAMHRSGRTSEALEVYRSARRLLTSELGVEPGLELQQIHQAVLRSDFVTFPFL
jgi:DNA-binding SARP family transcriptional activator